MTRPPLPGPLRLRRRLRPRHFAPALLLLAAAAAAQPAPPADAPEGPIRQELRQDLQAYDWPSLARDVWTVRLFNAGDTEIHLNQVVVALLVAALGFWLARRLSQLVHYRLTRHKRINLNVIALIQKLTFYALFTVALLVALPIAGIPITIFTVLGGAFAIGLGFGAQNLVNNLISGIILMTERPIRLGDIVEVEGSVGRVEEIGNRCTRIRRFDGIDVLMPNASLLENPVVNWTLKDADVRGKVAVGIAYGSPTATARDLILKAATEHARIHKKPEPAVLFTDFGDNALAFELLFWTAVQSPMDLNRIQSDLRYRIEHLFKEADISIAFPQRDLHLDTVRPLEVRMVKGDAEQP